MRRIVVPMLILTMAAGLVACTAVPQGGTAPAAPQAEPSVQPPAPAPLTPAQPSLPPLPPPDTRLSVSLTSSQGKKAQVYLTAPDERVVEVDASSCIAGKGDRLRSGHYDFYLLADGAQPVRQTLSGFTTEPLEFNDTKPQYLTVLPGQQGIAPDILLLQQYGSCNGTFAYALALSPDGKQLLSYDFVSKRTAKTTGISGMEQQGPGKLRTTVYNNATGITTTTTWEVREADKALVATNVEEKTHP